MVARLYRPFFMVAVLSGTIAIATWIYFNVALNKAAAQAFFVRTSSLVLLVLFFIVAVRYAVLVWVGEHHSAGVQRRQIDRVIGGVITQAGLSPDGDRHCR